MTLPADADLTVLERPRLIRETCRDLPLAGSDSTGARAAALDRIEVGGTASNRQTSENLRVVFWNVERGGRVASEAAFLGATDADIALLCELDNGLDRTGGAHVARALADRVGAAYVYGVEFVELEEAGARGWHGNAILTRVANIDPLLIRLAHADSWLCGRGQKRLGGRMALALRVPLAGRDVVVVSTHLESHGGPEERAAQMCALIDAVDEYAGGAPVLIGGDFNTRTASKQAMRDPDRRRAMAREEPERFVAPEPREPLFEIAREAGFGWHACNQRSPTERPRAEFDGSPRFRLDWFFARGLTCANARNIAAVGPDGAELSDHDAIMVDISLP